MKTLIKILCLSVLWFSCESSTEPQDDNIKTINGYVSNNLGLPAENVFIILNYNSDLGNFEDTTQWSMTTFRHSIDSSFYNSISAKIFNSNDEVVYNIPCCGLIDTTNTNPYSNKCLTWNGSSDDYIRLKPDSYTASIQTNDSTLASFDLFIGSKKFESWHNMYDYEYHTITDEDGFFSIPIEDLPLSFNFLVRDADCNLLGNGIISDNVNLLLLYNNNQSYRTDSFEINIETNSELNINLP